VSSSVFGKTVQQPSLKPWKCGREIAGQHSRQRLRVDLAARATFQRNLTAALETRQLASWAEETSPIASRRGASSNTVTEHLSSENKEQTAKTSAPTQLTLDTPRASAGAAGAALSEQHQALSDCDVDDTRASAAPSSSAAHAPVTCFCRAHNIVANQGAVFATRGSIYFGNGGRTSSQKMIASTNDLTV
jgi:hypothetical protein